MCTDTEAGKERSINTCVCTRLCTGGGIRTGPAEAQAQGSYMEAMCRRHTFFFITEDTQTWDELQMEATNAGMQRYGRGVTHATGQKVRVGVGTGSGLEGLLTQWHRTQRWLDHRWYLYPPGSSTPGSLSNVCTRL